MSVPLAELLREIVSAAPEARGAILRREGRAPSLLGELADEAERLALRSISEALDATEVLLALADEVGAARARARRARAQALCYANRFDEALALFDEGAARARAVGETVEEARIGLSSLHALARLGRYDEAVERGERARDALAAAGERVLAARADVNIGVTHRMRDDPTAALAHFDRARPVFADQPAILAQIDSNRAEALLDLNRYACAESAFLGALDAFQGLGMERAAAIVEGNLADLLGRQGRFARALLHFERALRRFEKDGAPGDQARLEIERAEALVALGLLEDAAATLGRALPVLEEHGMRTEAARARAALGRALARLGRRAAAAKHLLAAAAAFDSAGLPAAGARALLASAELHLHSGEIDSAGALVERARAALADRPADLAAALALGAGVALAKGRVKEAGELATEGADLAARADLPSLLADLFHLGARARTAAGDPAGAIGMYQRALEQVERVRGSLQAERFRAAFLGRRGALYEEAAGVVLAAGGPFATAQAFETIQRGKSRSLIDLLRGGVELSEHAPGAATDPDELELVGRLADARARLNALYSRADKHAGAALRGERLGCEQEIARIERRLASTRTFADLFGPPASLAQVRESLEPGWVLLEYFSVGGTFFAFAVGRDGAEVFQLGGVDAAVKQIDLLRFQIGRALARADDPKGLPARMELEARGLLAALYDDLLRPMEARIAGAARIIVSPYGPLHALPFHAMHDGTKHLIERFEVVYAPSAGVLACLRPRSAGNEVLRPLVVGVADERAPRIEEEAAAVAAGLAEATVLLGGAATVGAVMDASRRASLMHLACHGEFVPDAPLASGLRLSDGMLTVRDVYAMRLAGPVVTLSGCETGRTAVIAGEELAGLYRAFLAAGASALVVSYWMVHDEAASEALASIYRSWYRVGSLADSSLAAAVRRAQCELMATRPHPALWAPFALIGLA